MFFVAVIPGAISVALVFLVRERSHKASGQPEPRTAHPARAFTTEALAGLPRRYWQLLVVLGLFNVVDFSDLSYALLSYPAGVVSDRVARRVVYAIGLVVFALAYLGLGLTRSTAWV